MTRLKLRIGTLAYLHTLPLILNKIHTEIFDYTAEAVKNIDECTLRMINGDFDIGEMSFATFLKAQEKNPWLKALPVFTRKVPQVYAFCSKDSDLQSYKDLKGKKVAVFQYWVTASIWHRWLLAHHYGLDPKDIIWCPVRKDRIENMPYPEDYHINWEYLDQAPDDLLRSGEVDCFFYAHKPENFTGLRWLVPPVMDEQVSFLQNTGIVPIIHIMAIKEGILENHPEIIDEIMNLFEKSKNAGYREISQMASLYLPFVDWHLQQTQNMFGGKGWNEYGWSKNKHVLNVFCKAACEQGFVQNNFDIKDCFVHYDYEK